jgi:hypothetical protein
MQHRVSARQDRPVEREQALRRRDVRALGRVGNIGGGDQAPRVEALLQAALVRGRVGRGQADALAAAETADDARVPVPQQRREDRARAEPGEVHAAHGHPALAALQVKIVAIEERRAAVGFEGADVEHVLGHDRVADRPEPAPPGAVLTRAGGLAVVAQQPDRGRHMHAGPVPLDSRHRREAFGRTEIDLVEQVVGDHAQPRGLGCLAGRLRRVGHGLHARPARVVARERPDVERETEVVRGMLEVPAGALRGELERRVDAVEREPVLRGADAVELAHPRDEREVRRERAETVREALGHDRIERSDAVLDEVVHRERGHPVGFEGEGAEAALDELGEQLVADRPERGLAMIGLAQGHELVGVVDEIADVLSHGLKHILESSVDPLIGSRLDTRLKSLNLGCNDDDRSSREAWRFVGPLL